MVMYKQRPRSSETSEAVREAGDGADTLIGAVCEEAKTTAD